MERPTFYLLCDESGAKGYSDNAEDRLEDSLGIAVGVIAFEKQLSILHKISEELYKKYACEKGRKFHLTDLSTDNQKK